MNFSENMRLAWSCVRANKMRSILTMLGIIIGISAVITISTIGTSLRQTIQKTFSDLTGSNQIAVGYVDPTYQYDEESPLITLQDMQDFKDAFDGSISEVNSDLNLGEGKYQNGDDVANVSVVGTTEGYTSSYNYEVLYGRDITMKDSFENRKVCVVSENFVKYGLGGMDNPIGKNIEITLDSGDVISVYIIGVYKQTETQMADLMGQKVDEKDRVTSLVVPIQLVWDVEGVPDTYRGSSMVYFFNEPGTDIEVLKEGSKAFFERRRPKDSKYIVRVESLEEQLGKINTVLNVITAAISVIAAISLIVGGIGVMNIMLVSVVERTKEIGIRKAMGAKNRVIEMQFLVEAILICVIGGLLGILLGFINGGIISLVAKYFISRNENLGMLTIVVRPPIMAILISFFFSMLVGIIFGLYPARRAARLSPIDALRYE